MAKRLRFVQLPHPQWEAKPRHDQPRKVCWNKTQYGHKRKFMQFRGEWIEQDGNTCSGKLRAWGEWEPESDLLCDLKGGDPKCGYPRYLWRPRCCARKNYRRLHNTDPFIFGERILYSNCGQIGPSREGLRQLDQGSVVVFGSSKKRETGNWEWMLDTVLVVKDFRDYDCEKAPGELQERVPPEFMTATAEPLASNSKKRNIRLRLYRGATPSDRVCGMFSFFPALPTARDKGSGFPRPFVSLPDSFLNPRSVRGPNGHGRGRDMDMSQLRRLWESLVSQVRSAKPGLVLGTWAEFPQRARSRP